MVTEAYGGCAQKVERKGRVRKRKDNAETQSSQREREKMALGSECQALGVLEFLGDDAAGDLRSGSVLPDEMHVLQFSYGRGVFGAVFAVCGGGVRGDSGASGVVWGGGSGIAGGI